MSDKNKKNYLSAPVICPNWTCGGYLYLKNRKADEMWKCPDIVCDNCHTIFRNSEADRLAGESEKEQ